MANYKSTVFSEITTIADGIGYKLGNMVSSLVSLLAGYALAFVYCWQLSLVLAALFPIMLILGFVMSKVCVYVGMSGSFWKKNLEDFLEFEFDCELSNK